MNTSQVQLKLSLSQQLNNLLESKAARLGVPVTQFVKHIILKEVEDDIYPTFQMSEHTEQNIKNAMNDYNQGKATKTNDISEFLNSL
ncbi:MAG TPA: hypothetical protein VF810_05060 [Patescibacteria group bacterium]